MRNTLLALLISTAFIPGVALSQGSIQRGAACLGKDPCKACSNCKYCKYCAKNGKSCSVCKKKGAKPVKTQRPVRPPHHP
jgi:hypothetical protein